MRGQHPEPLEERAEIRVRRAGVEPALHEAGGLQPLGHANAQPTHNDRVTRVGVEPTDHEGRAPPSSVVAFAALPDCVPCHVSVLDGI